jgi:hypothetical protein
VAERSFDYNDIDQSTPKEIHGAIRANHQLGGLAQMIVGYVLQNLQTTRYLAADAPDTHDIAQAKVYKTAEEAHDIRRTLLQPYSVRELIRKEEPRRIPLIYMVSFAIGVALMISGFIRMMQ